MMPALAPAVEEYLAIQERFEAIRRAALARHGARLTDLSYANAYDGPDPIAIEAMRGALAGSRILDLQSTPYGGSTVTRRLIAQHLSDCCGIPWPWRNVVLTPGAMAALKVVFRAIRTDGHDEVVVVTPCWMDYPLYLADLGIRPRFVPVSAALHLDLDGLAAAIGPATRALILSQPANPTGVVYTQEELSALADLLQRQPDPPLFISDECHRDVAAGPVTSPATLYDRTCVIYSFGKSLRIQGQRIGYVAVSPRLAAEWPERFERVCRMLGVGTPTALMQIAVRSLIGYRPDLSILEARRSRAIAALRSGGYDLDGGDATIFLYPRAPDPDDWVFVERLAADGLLALPSAVFHQPGYIRLSLTASDSMIEAGLDVLRLARAGTH
jgi:aspartate aminotransferase